MLRVSNVPAGALVPIGAQMLFGALVPVGPIMQPYSSLPDATHEFHNPPISIGSLLGKLPEDAVMAMFSRSVAYNRQVDALERETAKDNWDDEHGKAIAAPQWVEAKMTLALAAYVSHVPEAFVGASGDGYVHLTWAKKSGDRAVLEIGQDHRWWSIIPIDPNVGCEQPVEIRTRKDAIELLRKFVDQS